MTLDSIKQTKKYLIVNADDFGLTEEINNGIIESHQKGIVTSVSLLATGEAFDHALKLIKENIGLGVGVHLALTHTSPVLPQRYIPTLLNRANRFYENCWEVILRLLTRKICLAEIEHEWEAQIKKVLDAGLLPTHLDSHQHIHIFPSLWSIVKRVCQQYRIHFVRYPLEENIAGCASFSHFLKWLCIRSLLNFIPIEKNNLDGKRADYFLGLGASGKMNEKNLNKYLSYLNQGVTELMCHPGNKLLAGPYQHWNYGWQTEREALTNPEIFHLIHQLNVNLINYRSFYG